MTRRERIEARLARRSEWADKADAAATAAYEASRRATDGIPFGQPILVGHHSERRHRRAIARSDSAMAKCSERSSMAKTHKARAFELARILDTSIFADDTDAIGSLAERAARREAWADRIVAINKWWRQCGKPRLLDGLEQWGQFRGPLTDWECNQVVKALRFRSGDNPAPFPAYATTNLRACVRRDRQRMNDVESGQKRQDEAETAPGGVVVRRHPDADYCSVRFAEKPRREILDALRAAEFYYSAKEWTGKASKLPPIVEANQ